MSENNTAEEEPLTPEEVPEGSGKSSKLKRNLIIIVPIILMIAGAIYFYLFVISAPKSKDSAKTETKKKTEVKLEQNAYFDLDPMVVALSPSSSKREYLRLDLTLQVASEEESKIIMEKVPMIKDSLIVFLRSLRATDFNSSSSTIYLKEEITKRINKIIAPIAVKEVLFQEITVN